MRAGGWQVLGVSPVNPVLGNPHICQAATVIAPRNHHSTRDNECPRPRSNAPPCHGDLLRPRYPIRGEPYIIEVGSAGCVKPTHNPKAVVKYNIPAPIPSLPRG